MEKKKTKKRLLFIDLIRVVATLFVVMHHIHFYFLNGGLFNQDELWDNSLFQLSLGDIGVSLFIFISGLGLAISLKGKSLNLKKFFRKRLLRIYPDFFVVYFFFFSWYLIKKYWVINQIKLPNFLLALTGLDTYLSSFFSFTGYYFFDWFIGFILLLYLLFPLIYAVYRKSQTLLLLLSSVLLTLSVWFLGDNLNFRILPLRLLEFSLGMTYFQVLKKQDIKNHLYILLFSLTAQIFFLFNPLFFLFRLIILDYLLIETAYFVSKVLKKSLLISRLITYLASISFVIFLVQHQLIIRLINDYIRQMGSLLELTRAFRPIAVATYLALVIIAVSSFITSTKNLLIKTSRLLNQT